MGRAADSDQTRVAAIELDEGQPLTDHDSVRDQTPALPPFDRALGTRNLCIAGIVLTYALGLLCFAIAMSIYAKKRPTSDQPTDDVDSNIPWLRELTGIGLASRTIIDLALNGAITVCTEILGYIHATSLRWALRRDGRLDFSSNLRLLTQASNSAANTCYTNLASSIALIFTYTAASQTIVIVAETGDYVPVPGRFMVNGIALLVMGLGLLVQAGIAHLCLFDQNARIPTWSSNVLTITLASMHTDPHLRHRDGRCMLSALAARSGTDEPRRPEPVQPSLRMTDSTVHYILLFVWLLCPVVLAWAVAITLTVGVEAPNGLTSVYLTESSVGSLICGLLLIAALQAFATLGLHAVELLVNRSRDEVTWRHAYTPSSSSLTHRGTAAAGAPKTYNSIKAAFTSWQSVGLYLLKPVVHWLFGNSVSEYYAYGFGYAFGIMNPHYTFALSAGSLVVAAFATMLAWHRPKGPIPAAWGHLQTLADLVDDWGVGKVERLYWGDKGEHIGEGTRHAGTSADVSELGEIKMDAVYCGITPFSR